MTLLCWVWRHCYETFCPSNFPSSIVPSRTHIATKRVGNHNLCSSSFQFLPNFGVKNFSGPTYNFAVFTLSLHFSFYNQIKESNFFPSNFFPFPLLPSIFSPIKHSIKNKKRSLLPILNTHRQPLTSLGTSHLQGLGAWHRGRSPCLCSKVWWFGLSLFFFFFGLCVGLIFTIWK